MFFKNSFASPFFLPQTAVRRSAIDKTGSKLCFPGPFFILFVLAYLLSYKIVSSGKDPE